MKRRRLRSDEQGTVLIIAVVTSVMLAGIMVALLSVSHSGHQQVGGDYDQLRNQYFAEGAAERLRVDLVNDYRRSRMTLPSWLASIRNGDRFADELEIDGHATTQVAGTSPATARSGWLDTATVADLSPDLPGAGQADSLRSTQVSQRISFGASAIFNLAFLTAKTDCMFCHIKVDGDVGSLDFFRPGWGVEGVSGFGSGTGSMIDGNLYVAGSVSNDVTNLLSDPKTINGAQITGNVEVNYSGPELPDDLNGDGTPDFPTIDPDVARLNANGSLTGSLTGVPLGGDFGDTADRVNLSELDGSYEGNLVLVGTDADPIHIDGNLFVSGDVVLRGAVTGRGAIYSGRNVYIAGDLEYVNPPRVAGDAEDADVVAQENIDAGKDELRLAARSNIVLGNYTNKSGDGSLLPMKLRQEEDYFRLQFGLNGTTYFDTETNQELKKVGTKFYDDQGREIPYTRIAEADKYDGAIKPSTVNQDGTVDLWLSDEQYREILGTQEIRDNTWRMSVKGDTTQVVNQLLANGFSSEEINLLRRNWNDALSSYLSGDLSGPDYDFTVRKVEDGVHTYTDQVERVDAFLYSNRRIAGKTSGTNLAIYGGMISQEIGILAPGRGKEWWMQASRYTYLNDVADQANPINGELYRHLAVNYDYRLRNGGFGFDLVAGSVGRRLLWRMN